MQREAADGGVKLVSGLLHSKPAACLKDKLKTLRRYLKFNSTKIKTKEAGRDSAFMYLQTINLKKKKMLDNSSD